jgi:hypothetical protein
MPFLLKPKWLILLIYCCESVSDCAEACLTAIESAEGACPKAFVVIPIN